MADEQQEPVKKSKKKWIILIVVLFLLGGAGAGVYFLFPDLLHGKIGGAEPKKEVVAQEKQSSLEATTVSLPPFRVNLADPLGKRFIKLVIEVQAVSNSAAQEVTASQAPIRDSIILLLSSKSYADLAPVESKVMLKTEIGERINQILGGQKVSQVFITDMIIQ